MTNQIDHVRFYLDAYKSMKQAAIEAIKNYGKELDIREACKLMYMKQEHYKTEGEIPEDELLDFIQSNMYSCAFCGKHGDMYPVNIMKVRYNEEAKDVEVYLESDECYIADWYYASWVSYDEAAVYMSILDFIKPYEQETKPTIYNNYFGFLINEKIDYRLVFIPELNADVEVTTEEVFKKYGDKIDDFFACYVPSDVFHNMPDKEFEDYVNKEFYC